MLKLIIQKYFQNVRKTYTLSGKIQSERWKSFERVISSEKRNVLVTMQPFPEVWRIFAEFGYFWNGFGDVFYFYSFLFLCVFYFNMRNLVWIGRQEPILTTSVMTDSLPQVVSSYYQ